MYQVPLLEMDDCLIEECTGVFSGKIHGNEKQFKSVEVEIPRPTEVSLTSM